MPTPTKRRIVDPKLPTGRKRLLPTIITSALAVGIILFATGQLPQLDALFNSANAAVQSHNDSVVRNVMHFAPAALFAAGLFVLGSMILSSVKGRRKSA